MKQINENYSQQLPVHWYKISSVPTWSPLPCLPSQRHIVLTVDKPAKLHYIGLQRTAPCSYSHSQCGDYTRIIVLHNYAYVCALQVLASASKCK